MTFSEDSSLTPIQTKLELPGLIKSFVEALYPEMPYRIVNISKVTTNLIHEEKTYYNVERSEKCVSVGERLMCLELYENTVTVTFSIAVANIRRLHFKPNEPHYL